MKSLPCVASGAQPDPPTRRRPTEVGTTPEKKKQRHTEYDPKAPELHLCPNPPGWSNKLRGTVQRVSRQNQDKRRDTSGSVAYHCAWARKERQAIVQTGGFTHASRGAMYSHGTEEEREEGRKGTQHRQEQNRCSEAFGRGHGACLRCRRDDRPGDTATGLVTVTVV